jgi:omega-6 fatty acid desaturase (delta-12 desaturase)
VHDECAIFRDVPSVSFADGLRAVRLKLWDEEKARLVTWREVRRGRMRSAALSV